MEGIFMLFLLIFGATRWIWVFVQEPLFVHVNLFHLLFNVRLLLINQPTRRSNPTLLQPMHKMFLSFMVYFLVYSFIYPFNLDSVIYYSTLGYYLLTTNPAPADPTPPACNRCTRCFCYSLLIFIRYITY